MSDRPRCPVVHFDHHSAEHAKDHVGSYHEIRTSTPVAWTEAHGGYWVLSDYQSVFDASRNDDLFSSQRYESGGEGLAIIIPKAATALHIPIELDPPIFRSYRKILNKITAPAAVTHLDAVIDSYVTYFIDEIIERGEADLAVVASVPAATTLCWLGLDVADYKRYVAALHTLLVSPPGSPEYFHAQDVEVPWVNTTVHEHIRYRRENPGDDATTALTEAEVDGRPMTDDEIYSMMELLISGGVGTTASLVTQTLVWLGEHTDVREQLIEDPAKLDIAVEEFLRVFSPTQALARTVTEDVDFQGCPMREGDRALLAWSSANRDPQQFEEPDHVDIARWPNRHMAFGLGVHRCAGSHIARPMAKKMIGQVLQRMPDYEVITEGVVPYVDQGVNAGYEHIPVRFTPGERRGSGVLLGAR